jgi:probable DNA metabolism protein
MTGLNLIYDGSFEGFLTCVFEAYPYKQTQVQFQRADSVQQLLFAEGTPIDTESIKADRVWKGLTKKLSRSGVRQIYFGFLSEMDDVEELLFDYIVKVFSTDSSIETNFSDATVLKLSNIVKQVGREKHRMEAFLRFKLTKDGWYFANIEPDFDVLPLIAKHFKDRYADQRWMIYDIKRKYAIVYNLEDVEFVTMEFNKDLEFTKTDDAFFAKEELEFQELWKKYFNSSNIKSRKNIKLHTRHIPKRYWKYLSEKQP